MKAGRGRVVTCKSWLVLRVVLFGCGRKAVMCCSASWRAVVLRGEPEGVVDLVRGVVIYVVPCERRARLASDDTKVLSRVASSNKGFVHIEHEA